MGGRFSEAPIERLLGVAPRLFHQLAPSAALRDFDRDPSIGLLGQGFLEKLAVAELAIEKDPLGRRHILVKLNEKARQDFGFRHVIRMRREESPVSPILAAPDEEGLDRHGPRLACERKDVGIAKAFGMNRLASLDVGERPQAVPINGGEFVILFFSGFGHEAGQAHLDTRRLARKKLLRLVNQLDIISPG